MLHLWISYQLYDVRLQEFYIHSVCVINHCTEDNFNALISRANDNFSKTYIISFREFGYEKTILLIFKIQPAFSISM